jgi:predicted nucleotidyltransferase
VTNRLNAALGRLVADLDRHQARYAVVGGLAVSVRAEPRLTRDVDVAVSVANDDDAEALVRALNPDGYRIVTLVEQERSKRLATVRLITPGQDEAGVVADLLFASSGIEQEVVAAAESLEVLRGLEVRVAQVGHLIALKLLARDDRHRPQDADDLAALRRVADDEQIARAREAVQLIAARGFARGRDLPAAFADWLDERR